METLPNPAAINAKAAAADRGKVAAGVPGGAAAERGKVAASAADGSFGRKPDTLYLKCTNALRGFFSEIAVDPQGFPSTSVTGVESLSSSSCSIAQISVGP